MSRTNKSADSFKYLLWFYIISDEFHKVCSTLLPTKAMRESSAGNTVLGHALGEIFQKWLIEAVRNERKAKDPHLFQVVLSGNLSQTQLKSETNRVLAWAVASASGRIKDKSSKEYKLLNEMVCFEKDIGEEYIKDRYSLDVLLRNIGGDGGLNVLKDPFLEFGMKFMRLLAKELNTNDFTAKGRGIFGIAKKNILQHSIRSDFIVICNRLAGTFDFEIDNELCRNVYELFATKACNARFGEVHMNYNLENDIKGKGSVSLRTELLVKTTGGGRNAADVEAVSNTAQTETTAASSSRSAATRRLIAPAPAPPTHKYTMLKPGEGDAVSGKILEGKTFVISGSFSEVNTCDCEAHESIKKMIQSFGGKVQKNCSKNVCEFALRHILSSEQQLSLIF